MGGEGRAEGAGGVQGAAGVWADGQNAEGDGQADAEASDGAKGTAFVDRGGEDDEDEEEGGDGFEDHGRDNWKVAKERGGAERDGAPGFFRDDGSQQEGRSDAAEDLRRPIEKSVKGADALGDPEAEVAAGFEGAPETG